MIVLWDNSFKFIMNKERTKPEPALKKAMTFAEDAYLPKQETNEHSEDENGAKDPGSKEGNMHQLILSEFKVKYDQLQSQY